MIEGGGAGLVGYEEGLSVQESWVGKVREWRRVNKKKEDEGVGKVGNNMVESGALASSPPHPNPYNAVVLLQHSPLYTCGSSTSTPHLPLSLSQSTSPSVPVHTVSRGGSITYHGPGQITVYPILDLRDWRKDVHWYVRALEEVGIRAVERVLEEKEEGSGRLGGVDGLTGIFALKPGLQPVKIGAVGVKVRSWCTMHGLAINVGSESEGYFDGIVPCGIDGVEVGSVE
eukprot:CAMPEP_0118639470 /NCGR_PEP_ID=MMETSP0785-20121206/4239_1 /TAXON_ID=91992 /ORGANISM="Bolidomonas pacifica, Strain CCMP 1866" /LENGTH=228 /DNA_ID=CAMNT_0006530797 /DNA_START=415 /DNA_END=1097 /DNA_ORIENTATION=-